MAEVKLTKNELRSQQLTLNQLQKYLPTLQLKKAMLQAEVNEVRAEIARLEDAFDEKRLALSTESGLLSQNVGVDFSVMARVDAIQKHYENIAGVEIPIFDEVSFHPFEYPLFSTPAWLDGMLIRLRQLVVAKAQVIVAHEKREALEKELREVSIRVNLFEKNLIPKSVRNIKRIKVFLGDQELAAVGQAKVAKSKIERKKRAR